MTQAEREAVDKASGGKSATERMAAARDATLDILTMELCYAALFASRAWPSFLAPTERPDKLMPLVLCIDSPAGRLAYKVSEAEADSMLAHVERRENDGVKCSRADRHARLITLATET